MNSLEAELERARALAVSELADAIESIGFECTRCGACCTSHGEEAHTATVFPDEVRRLQGGAAHDGADGLEGESERENEGVRESQSDDTGDDPRNGPERERERERDWRDVARPMPYGLLEGDDGLEGETFEWALQTDGCGDCAFYAEDDDGRGACTVHADRPLICQTYPFSIDFDGTSQPMGEAVDSVALEGEAGDESGIVRAHECEGLGRDISRADAEALARTLKARAVRELEEAIAVRDAYEPADPAPGEVVVHDSEGAKRLDGTPLADEPDEE